jgi:CAAX protease family protein
MTPNQMGVTAAEPGGWKSSRWLALCEIAIVVLLFVADWNRLIPISKTPFILLLGWVSLRNRKIGWKEIGFHLFRNWQMTLLAGIAGGIFIEGLELFVTQPILVRLTGEQPDLSLFRPMIGNAKLFVLGVLLAWTLAAFGEELVYRGYVMNRFADLGNRKRIAWIVSLILTSTLFAFAHTYQGITGVIEAGIDGLFLGLMYLGSNRGLAVPIIAHGVQDTVDVLLIFLGKYPGM